MRKQPNNLRLSTQIVSLLGIIIALVILMWRESQIVPQNLLTNPGFETAGLAGWQINGTADGQINSKLATGDPNNTILTLAISDVSSGSWVGAGQRVTIMPHRRYKLTTSYRLVSGAQSDTQIIWLISQFNKAGELISTDRIPISEPLEADEGEQIWKSFPYTFIVDEQTEQVEIGLGLFGYQATTVEIDHIFLKTEFTWADIVRTDSISLFAALLLITLICYSIGYTVWNNWELLTLALAAVKDKAATINWPEVLAVSLLTILTILLFWPVVYQQLLYQETPKNDYNQHVELARQIVETGTIQIPHFLFHLLTIAQAWFLGGDFAMASLVVSVIFYLLLSLVIYALFSSVPGRPFTYKTSFVYVLLTLSLLVVSPITFFTWNTQNLYLGYIGLNVHHNPTIILLKPLALLLFIYVTPRIVSRQSGHRYRVFITGLLILLSTLAKPSYLICILPVLAIYVSYAYYKKQPVDWYLMLLGVAFPAIVVLGWQYYLTYVPNQVAWEEAQITFSPFTIMLRYTNTFSWMFLKFVLSILFPSCIYLLYFKKARQNTYLNLAWLIFLMGIFYTYFMTEVGRRANAGNFTWSGQITLFILFVLSTQFFVEQNTPFDFQKIFSRRFIIGATVFGLHLVSGFLAYYVHLTGPGHHWW